MTINLPILLQHQGRQLQTIRVVMARLGVKSMTTVWRWRQGVQFPRPVIINGIRYWYRDEVDAWMANLPRGQGFKPTDGLTGRARQIAQARAIEPRKSNADRNSNGHNGRGFVGPTPRFGFVRRSL